MYIGNLSMKSGQRQDFSELIVHGKQFGLHRDKMIVVETEKDYPGSRNKMPQQGSSLRKQSQVNCCNNQDKLPFRI